MQEICFFTTEVQSIVDIPFFKKYPLYPGFHRNWNAGDYFLFRLLFFGLNMLFKFFASGKRVFFL